MSGFLQRLAQRESGALPALSPRLGSWFDPRHVCASTVDDESEQAATPRPGQVSAPAPTLAAPVAPNTARSHAMPDPILPAMAPRDPPQGPALTVRAPRPLGAQLERTAPPRQPPARSALLAAAPQARVSAAAVGPEAPTRRHGALPVPPIPAPPVKSTRVLEQTARAPLVRAAQAQTPALQPASPHFEPMRLAPAALQAVRAAEARRDARAAPAPATIEVTIGRLEVRASVRSEAAAPAQRAKQSPTSLDDYLAKRNGEVRQ